jgi:Ca2+-binding RTX toxin-like protein
LPADGEYFIEVDTFRRDPADPICGFAGLPANISDACSDADVGSYELLVYTFATANSSDGLDQLIGREGLDVLNGGPDESYELTLELGDPPVEPVMINEPFTRVDIPFVDRGGGGWTATVDYGDGSGAQPLELDVAARTFDLVHAYVAAGTPTMVVTITNDDGQSVTDTLALTVIDNLPPVITFGGPFTTTRGHDQPFVFTTADPNLTDQNGPFTLLIDWGDGTPLEVFEDAGANQSVPHAYQTVGQYTITASAIDPLGMTSELPATATVAVERFGLQADPLNPENTALVVGGTDGNDQIYLRKTGDPQVVIIKINENEQSMRVTPNLGEVVQRFVIYGLGGDDLIEVDTGFTIPTMLFGGDGNDRIKGGAAADIIDGGAGNERIDGNGGRDLIIGGLGADDLHGVGDDDILIAGRTAYDGNLAALDAVMSEWNSARDYATRLKNLSSAATATPTRSNGDYFLNETTVLDDGLIDALFGEGQRDWFLANLDGDGQTARKDKLDKKSDETAHDVDIP